MDGIKYNILEPTIQNIHRKYISLPENEVKRNNQILHQFLEMLLHTMKEEDLLFRYLFQRSFYGGSFYEGLKINHPNKFDIHLLLKLPTGVKATLIATDSPGHGIVNLEHFIFWKHETKPKLQRLLGDPYVGNINNEKVTSWMQSLVHIALNKLTNHSGVIRITDDYGQCVLHVRRRTPAWNIEIQCPEFEISVDLVPCFIFDKEQLPNGYRTYYNPSVNPEKNQFFVCAKTTKSASYLSQDYWRLSFQIQEIELIKGKEKFKPTLRLLKKLKEKMKEHDFIMPNYGLKHAMLIIDEEKTRRGDLSFWSSTSQSYIFVTVLKRYIQFLQGGYLPSYWHPKINLIDKNNHFCTIT